MGLTIQDYEEVLADKRRLTRELDVAMHGEDLAAKQASLCDLIPAAERLAEIEYATRFLVERLREYEADGCQCDQSVREWCGHVSPALARAEMALKQ